MGGKGRGRTVGAWIPSKGEAIFKALIGIIIFIIPIYALKWRHLLKASAPLLYKYPLNGRERGEGAGMGG